jgi:putative endonuclease
VVTKDRGGKRDLARELRRQAGHLSADRRPAVGRRGEYLAAAHLERLGYGLLARNERTAAGEIDLIAIGEGVLVFVEVKTASLRRDAERGPIPCPQPLESLRAGQRARIRRAAAAWLRGDGAHAADPRPRAGTIRFDAIGVLLDRRGELARLDHIEGAW